MNDEEVVQSEYLFNNERQNVTYKQSLIEYWN